MGQYGACAVTGYHPSRFKFKYQENYTLCKKIKERMAGQFEQFYRQGVRCFFVPGTLGVGIWAGEILARMKEQPEFEKLELVIVIPFEGHDRDWDDRSKKRLAFLRKFSARIYVAGKTQASDSYRLLNHYLLDHADVLLAVYDGLRSKHGSGIELTVKQAGERGIDLILIHPDTGAVTKA